MNSSIHIFGRFEDGYSQYPDDYTREIFEQFELLSNRHTQVITHRQGDIVYYGYVRKLDTSKHYIGFCVNVNGVVFDSIPQLFVIFENAIATLTGSGEIIRFNEKGDIVPATNYLYNRESEIARISSIIKSSIDGISYSRIPPVDYSISSSENRVFNLNDDENDIYEAIAKYGYVSLSKDSGYDTATLTEYRGVIKALNGEKEELKKKYNKLTSQYNKLKRQQKQFRGVIILLIILLVGGCGSLVLYNNLLSSERLAESRMQQIESLNKSIDQKNAQIQKLDKVVSQYKEKLEATEVSLQQAEKKIDGLESDIIDLQEENDVLRHQLKEKIEENNYLIQQIKKYIIY